MARGADSTTSTTTSRRSQTELMPWNGTPRWLHSVSPESANLASLTDEAAMPASCMRSSTVRWGCQSSGSTGWSHLSELSRWPLPGTRDV